MTVPITIHCAECGYPEAGWYASFIDGDWLCYDCAKGSPVTRCKECWEMTTYCQCATAPLSAPDMSRKDES